MSNIVLPPQQYPQYISEPYNQDDEHLLKSSKYKSAKGFLTCLLILPILFFIVCLVLFIILICNQHSSTVSVDHAISTTEQFGADINAEPWNKAEVKAVDCATTALKKTLIYSEFQGIENGKINKVTVGKQYDAVDYESDCTGDCKIEPGISPKPFQFGEKASNRVCYTTLPYDQYQAKGDAACPTGFTVTCTEQKLCAKTGTTCPLTSITSSAEATGTKQFPVTAKGLSTTTNLADKKFIIGIVGGFSPLCKNPEYLNNLPSNNNYGLLGIEYSGCDEYGIYDTTQLPELYNEITYKTILEKNGLVDTVATNTKSPYFYTFAEDQYIGKYKLYTKYRPDTKTDAVCRNNGFDSLGTVRQYLNSTNRALFVYTLTGLVLSALGLLFWLALIGSTYTAKSRKTRKGSSQLLKVVHLLAIVLAILLIILYIHYMTIVDEDMDKMETVQTLFNKAEDASCYDSAGGWNSAFEKVRDFINVALNFSYPFVITFFIIGLVYLVLVLIVFAATKAKGVSPCLPPYLLYAHQ